MRRWNRVNLRITSQSRRFNISRGRYQTEWYFYSDIILLLSSADKFDYAYNVSTIETRSDDQRVQIIIIVIPYVPLNNAFMSYYLYV